MASVNLVELFSIVAIILTFAVRTCQNFDMMAARDEASKRQRGADRLSSLSDDILIDILSRLPLRFSVSTGCLSQRWRGLWTNLTSIDMSYTKFKRFSEFLIFFDSILMKIVSPSIYRFSVDLGYLFEVSTTIYYEDSWLRQLHDRNVCEVNITWPNFLYLYKALSPRFIFETQSLTSVEMHSNFCWGLHPDDSDHPFNLPNLKNLSVSFSFYSSKGLEKLIHDCPSLEKLSLTWQVDWIYEPSNFRCSNQNLRCLIFKFDSSKSFYDLRPSEIFRKNKPEVGINAPKLEYLAVRAPKVATFCFDENPVMLHEAKIEITDGDPSVSDGQDGLISSFHVVISNVKVLTIDGSALDYTCNEICNATQIKLNMKTSHSVKFVSSLLELCPSAEILTLQFQDISKHQVLPKATNVSTALQSSPKRLEIEVCWPTYRQPAKSFLKFVKYLLSTAIGLEGFRFTVVGEDCGHKSEDRKQRKELKLCELLYRCPMVSMGCEVEFFGRFLNMSRKSGPKARKPNGEVICFKSIK